ncbi:hypothetical protein Mapa_016337 [Marchantia paleacea]|nr:hypothetical protein Mapa_016337 [Marchantia paleacea]
MAFRGGRGGRGRGRGGRGFPVMRDEDGMALIPKSRDGPPPLFPTLENLPPLPDLTPKDESLVSRRRHLESAWNVSPYYIEKPKAKSVGVAAEIERYSDRYKLSVQTKRPPLSSVLKLASAYFPAELLSQGNQKRSQQADGAQWTLQTGSAKNDLQRLDQLASLEQKRLKDGEDKADVDKEEKKKKEGDEGDDDDDEEKLDDEDEEFGDDDYAQNFGFDDDEDYLDMDDGGDDGSNLHLSPKWLPSLMKVESKKLESLIGRQTTLISNSRLEVGVEGRIFGEDPRGSSAHNSLRGKCTADRCLQLNPLTVTVNTTVLEGGSRRNRMVLCFYKFVSGLE